MKRKYVNDAIDSTFVSSVGEYVNRFEQMMCELTGANFAVATVNGTSALHVALRLVGVRSDTEVIAPTPHLCGYGQCYSLLWCRARLS